MSDAASGPRAAVGSAGRRIFQPGDAAYAEICWTDPTAGGAASYDLIPGAPRRLDDYVARIIAPNAGMMTGAGTNTYLLGRRELAVIDPGPDEPSHIEAILAAGGGRIRQILCTHSHFDHSRAAAALKSLTGARIVGMSPPDTHHDDKLVLDRIVADGDCVEVDGLTLRVVFTPGHASNHVCFLVDSTGMLFTGDHIMQGSTVVIWPPDGNMKQYLESLRALHGVRMKILAPGHGYLIGDPHAEVDRLIHHRLAREEKVRNALHAAGGRATLEVMLPRVYADVPQTLHAIAAQSLQAHLEKLVEDGELALVADHYVGTETAVRN